MEQGGELADGAVRALRGRAVDLQPAWQDGHRERAVHEARAAVSTSPAREAATRGGRPGYSETARVAALQARAKSVRRTATCGESGSGEQFDMGGERTAPIEYPTGGMQRS